MVLQERPKWTRDNAEHIEINEIHLQRSPDARWIDHHAIPTAISRQSWQKFFTVEREKARRTQVAAWHTASIGARINAERLAADALLKTRSRSYQDALEKAADAMEDMHPEQRLTLIIPSFNEHEAIPNLLEKLSTQTDTNGDPINPNLWGAIIVINCPISRKRMTAENLLSIDKTIEAIADFKSEFLATNGHEFPVDYVVSPFLETDDPDHVPPGTATARMIGNDLVAMRSSKRGVKNRTGTMYIQTIDADTESLHPHYLATLLTTIQDRDDRITLFRQKGEFTRKDRIKHPDLNTAQLFWNESLQAIADHTDSPWTVGRGMLVSLYDHARSGGIFPFRHRYGNYDEDTRIGVTIQELHGSRNMNFRETIQLPLFFQESSRETYAMGHLRHFILMNGPTLTRRGYNIATFLESYDDYANTIAIGRPYVLRENSSDWLENQEAFDSALPHSMLSLMANAWRELVRTELSIHAMKSVDPAVHELWEQYVQGNLSQIEMRNRFNQYEYLVANDPEELDESIRDAVVQAIQSAGTQATEFVAQILTNAGIQFETEHVERVAQPYDDQAEMPQPFTVTGSDKYREKLRQELL